LRGFHPIVVVALVGLMLAPDADAAGHGRRAARNNNASSQYLHARQNPLDRLPVSALNMPADIRMTSLATSSHGAAAIGLPAPAQSVPGLRIPRQGSIASSVTRGYKRFCDNLSARVWDEPNGRRLSFDVHGKPGVAVEIPLH
jgi:hypothetical protein